MKKILAVLSLTCFLAVNISVAQTASTAPAKETKKETVAKTEAAPAAHACCKGGSMKNCSAEQMKNCTAAEKAACAKGEKTSCAHGDKAKADAGTEKKEGTKANNN